MPIRGVEAEWPRQRSTASVLSLRLGWLALATIVVAGLAFRFRVLALFEFIAGIAVGSALAGAALLTAAASLRDLWRRGGEGARAALGGVLIALVALAPVMGAVGAALILPAGNDVSTDPASPPDLGPVSAQRRAAVVGRGARLTVISPADYPDLAPLIVQRPLDLVFEAARALAQEQGWTIVAAAPPPPGAAVGSIVATASTMLLDLKDDVAIRVTPTAKGTRVDMRSASRLGRHDFGANAARIRDFLDQLDRRLNEPQA